jgi:iron complex transport system ATP-binding protein
VSSGPAITVDGLTCRVGGVRALQDVTLSMAAGELHGVVGPNGAGKTTLLRAIAGVVAPSAGRVLVEDAQPHRMRAPVLARRMAVLTQHPVAPPGLTVREAVSWGRMPHLGRLAAAGQGDLRAVDRALDATGMQDLADRLVSTLSGGERQRALIARALAQEPRILLLDEPTAHLDAAHQVEVMRVLRRLAGDRLTIVVALHDLRLAAAYCDRLALLAHGRLLAAGPPAAVLTDALIQAAYGAAALGPQGPRAPAGEVGRGAQGEGQPSPGGNPSWPSMVR